MTVAPPVACDSCMHLLRSTPAGQMWCEAFPVGNGVPIEVTDGLMDHVQPIEGDGGVRWELRPGREETRQVFLDRLERGLNVGSGYQ